MKRLDEKLNSIAKSASIVFEDYLPIDIPENLNPKMELRPYQKGALGRFIYYHKNISEKKTPSHLLFQMATGSGKTLVMASLMLYLYKCGYRRFLFFVNSNNIIEKTRDNFLNEASLKFLFANKINIGGKSIKIAEVENFHFADEDGISIIFTTVQALHTRLQNPKENSFTIADLTEQPIVLLSDEAHHINVQTKSIRKENEESTANWEKTILEILNANTQNVLLEFTATADLLNEEVGLKYHDKLIFDYSLRTFRREGYSKEVKVLQTVGNSFERAIMAVLMSQHRKIIFAKYDIFCKPVILFKSKTIQDSREFLKLFSEKIESLSEKEMLKFKEQSGAKIIGDIFSNLEPDKISLSQFIQEIKSDFSREKLIAINSKEESEEKQLAINSLEHPDNLYRAVFAVDKLNEGWDVLNLFDIVRLYDSPISSGKKISKTTVAEAQLIGRGARYFPFQFGKDDSVFKRKFDEQNHPLKLGETLYYHSSYNPGYIHELHNALVEIGIQPRKNESPNKISKEPKKNTSGTLFPKKRTVYDVHLDGFSVESDVFKNETEQKEFPTLIFPFLQLGERVILKALYRIPFFHFDQLKTIQKDLTSIKDLVGLSILKPIWCQVFGNKTNFKELTSEEKLSIAINVLLQIKENFKVTKEPNIQI